MQSVGAKLYIQTRCVLRLGTALSSSQQPRSLKTGTGEGKGLGGDLTVGEKRIITKLQEAFPDASHLHVADVSGGCGAMYHISIESPEFIGQKTIQQHRMVNQALAEEIKSMHGLQLKTKAPDTDKEGI